MKSDYFNSWELKQSVYFFNTDPIETKLRLEQYLENHPKDYFGYIYYTSILIVLGELKEAEKILNLVDALYSRNGHFLNEFEKVKLLENQIINTKVSLLCQQEKYEELLEFCERYYEKIDYANKNAIIFYCKKKLNKISPARREPNSYIYRQIVDYQEKDFLEHIKKHLADYRRDTDCLNSAVFVPNFPIDKVLKEIKKFIPSEKKLLGYCYESIYFFKYDECGRNNNKLVNYIEVVCFNNTNDIITLYPIDKGEQLPYIDLNYLIRDNEIPKVKRLSQAEKFKQRYNSKKKVV